MDTSPSASLLSFATAISHRQPLTPAIQGREVGDRFAPLEHHDQNAPQRPAQPIFFLM
jgi:hypothetical protein